MTLQRERKKTWHYVGHVIYYAHAVNNVTLLGIKAILIFRREDVFRVLKVN